MIQIKREDKMSINLSFNNKELVQILDSLKKAYKGEQVFINALIDPSVISMKKGTIASGLIEIKYVENGEAELFKLDNQIFWVLNKEDIEVAFERLEQCKDTGCFTPRNLFVFKFQITKTSTTFIEV